MSNLQLTGHGGEVLTLGYNNTGNLLATAGMDKQVLVWDCKDSYSNILNLKSHTNAVISLSWSYTDHLVTGSADKTICNWDIETGKLSRKYKGHTSIIQSVSCPKKTRELIASVGDDGALRIWEQRSK
jgi:Prp8 binding protein